jgi:hypothetical protein
MLTDTELARVLVSWKNRCGEEIRGRMCVSIDGRCDMYKNLIKTLIELHNYTLEDFEGKTYRAVMEASIPGSSTGQKLEKWRQAATTDWFNAMDSFFPQTILTHDSSNEPERPRAPRPERPASPEYDNGPIELKNPLDKSIFTGLPKVKHIVDEDFLKQLDEVDDE